jgi:hypothetical protein
LERFTGMEAFEEKEKEGIAPQLGDGAVFEMESGGDGSDCPNSQAGGGSLPIK